MKDKSKIDRDEHGHIIPREKASYNERLFRSGVRRNYHEARFNWLEHQFRIRNIQSGSIIELGCFDARSLRYIPFRPDSYLGFDANWENGLDLARQEWDHEPGFHFKLCLSPADFIPPVKAFDFGICLETLEHLEEIEVPAYLEKLSQTVRQAVFVTVPVEIGPLAVLKYLYKRFFLEVDEPYRSVELWHLFRGNSEKIDRVPRGHKGFDYRRLEKTLEKYFHIESRSGLPFTALPVGVNLSCCFVLRPLN